jgi:site-specific recombinase XerD
MNKLFEYTSVFAPYIEGYIHEKELQSYKATQLKWILLEFDKFFAKASKNDLFISSKNIKDWAATRTCDKPNTLYQKYCAIAKFCRYMCLLGYECYIPTRPKKRLSNYTPTIFTHEQMKAIFNACDNMVMKEHHAQSIMIIIPALFRVLYSTGIRVSEALSLLNRDVDLNRRAIILNDTKNRCQRLAPVNESLEHVLRQYIFYRNKIPVYGIAHPSSPLFVSTTGKPCSRRTVLAYFHRVLEECGIPRRCEQQGPMVHEIRHSAAVHAMIKLTQDGLDPYTSLPLLSTFMGHKKVWDTENYVRLTQEMYPDLLKMGTEAINQVYSCCLPKLKQDYENRCDGLR